MRILVVDDDLSALSLIQHTLHEWGYKVQLATSSNEAIHIFQQEVTPFAIINWAMPSVNGSDLCRSIRALNLPYYTYIILVTSLGGSESVIDGLEAGADDFVRKPILMDEFHARIKSGERVLKLEKTLQERNQELLSLNGSLLAAQDNVKRDLETAAKMQYDLLPAATLKYLNVAIDWLFCPSAMVSGDIFNFFRLDETHVGFYVLDVAGHGIPSAMMSFSLFRLLTTEMQRGSPLKRPLTHKPYYRLVDPSDVMTELNAQFQINADNWLYFTMVYGVADTVNHTIEICQAGHPSPIFLAKDKEQAQFVGDGGFPVGLAENAQFENIVLNYSLGDRLVLYSDGVIECLNEHGEMFGVKNLQDFIEGTKSLAIHEVSKKLNERICQWRGNHPFDDDVSMLILEIT